MQVRNEKADEFLALLREWAVLCDQYVNKDVCSDSTVPEDQEDDSTLDKDEFVVEKLIGICYGGSGRKNGIYFKVHMCYLFMLFAWISEKGFICMPAVFKHFQEKSLVTMEI